MSTRQSAKTKGYIKNTVTGEIMKFQFNPETFSYARGVTYAEIGGAGSSYPITQFVKGNIRVFTIELFIYDKPSTGLHNKTMLFLGKFLTPETNTAGYKKPPAMIFCYAYFIRTCVLDNLNIELVEIDTTGSPTQTKFTLTLRQVSP